MPHLSEPVVIALIAAVPSTIGAFTLVAARANRRQLETPGNGTAGDHLATIADSVMFHSREITEMRADLLAHIRNAEPELVRQGKQLAVLQATVDAHLAEDRQDFAAIRASIDQLTERL